MKRHFGTFLTRSFLGAGTDLTEVEHRITEELIASLPEWLKTTVEIQMDAYNLVQREIDGRALNFYRKRLGRGVCMDGLPSLEMHGDEAPLARITLQVGGGRETVHATLNAVAGRVFCIAFNRRVDALPVGTTLTVTDRKEAWRSNFPRPNKQGEQGVGGQPATTPRVGD